ncbi:unnamed protein product [Rhizoctonia solani]|uniref:Uncharacterized protein n=1 Tax=Rhizoctonia solani TaxID=456999 RepID=A0A8H3AQR5_9AGAM|nr:unnamed protein product [Rhizoctonia solani]
MGLKYVGQHRAAAAAAGGLLFDLTATHQNWNLPVSLSAMLTAYSTARAWAMPIMAAQNAFTSFTLKNVDDWAESTQATRPNPGHFPTFVKYSPFFTGIMLVAGNTESTDARCWEQVLTQDQLKNMDVDKKALYGDNGMLLQDLISYCNGKLFTSSDNTLILCNDRDRYFAFSVTMTVPAGTEPDISKFKFDADVIIVHVVSVDIVKRRS